MALLNQALSEYLENPLAWVNSIVDGTYYRGIAEQNLCLKTSVKSLSGLRGKKGQSKITSADESKTPVLLDPHFLQGLHHYKYSLPSATLA